MVNAKPTSFRHSNENRCKRTICSIVRWGLEAPSLSKSKAGQVIIDKCLPSIISCRTNFVLRALRKHLLSFLVTLVKSLSRYTKAWRLDKERIFIGDLAYALALNLDLADNPQFYDLPVLETSLVCLAHITAQPRWSSYCKFSQGTSLCIQLMTSLVQVRFSFFQFKR